MSPQIKTTSPDDCNPAHKSRLKHRPDPEKINAVLDYKEKLGDRFPRYAVFVVAYSAMEKLLSVIERIPPEIYKVLSEVYIFDDFSPDRTYEVCRAYLDEKKLDKVSLYRNPRNYGYGGNQKLGYEYAVEKGYDYVILLHGDGQYAPEFLADLMLPTLRQGAQAVFGSRMIRPGEALAGGMPRYKYYGNRLLTKFENLMLHTDLTEFHSGYRLYGSKLLSRINYKLNTDDFHFDTQIIIQCLAAGEKIFETPIPTYYGDEICHVNGIKYAWDVFWSVLDYRLHRLGITRKERYVPAGEGRYSLKDFPRSSHRMIVNLVEPGSNVLDLGCGPGTLAGPLKEKGCKVTGVDLLPESEVPAVLDRYVQADLANRGLPFEREFDCVILSDVVEHLADPDGLVSEARRLLKEGGHLVMSVPNVALWVYRLSLLAGRFEYADRGIMDRTHLKFFTLVTARYLLWRNAFAIEDERYVPIPFHLLGGEAETSRALNALTEFYYLLARAWPRMFAYQVVMKARPVRLEWKELDKLPFWVDAPHPHLDRDGGVP